MLFTACSPCAPEAKKGLTALQQDSIFMQENYRKEEFYITMRDGIRLYTVAFIPNDAGQDGKQYPILLSRTTYDCAPYGPGKYPRRLGPNRFLMREKNIIVYQDVRGRWMSEGTFDNMRANIPGNDHKTTDESSDTFDTIDWLIKSDLLSSKHNGRVGMWGISYPGFYTIAGAVDAHPALVASSPQAPVSDFYFDDFHHHGAFLQSYWIAVGLFGYQKADTTSVSWYKDKMVPASKNYKDGYDFYMDLGALSNSDKFYGPDNFFWKELVEHPNYDSVWQSKSIIPHLKNVNHAVLTVGGWFDAEDLYGPLNIYKNLEANNPDMPFNGLVMGPWSHGDWARNNDQQYVSQIYFGDSLSYYYQKQIETPFFNYHLKQDTTAKLPAKVTLFDTGSKTWKTFDQWPPKPSASNQQTFYFGQNQKLATQPTPVANSFSYVSNPDKPVPYVSEPRLVFVPRKFMTEDQRHAARRPDVLTFQTEPLEEAVTLQGEIMAKLQVSTTGTDADWVVKLIDVYPANYEKAPQDTLFPSLIYDRYQHLVRSEVFRGRFRNSYENPEPFVANQKTAVNFPVQDVLHTFKKGHRIMIQIHSTWFPYIDRNPQKFVPNIFKASDQDFESATMTLHGESTITINQGYQINLPYAAYGSTYKPE